MEKKNYGTMEKNYGTLPKTMVLWKKLWYFTKNDGTIPKTMER